MNNSDNNIDQDLSLKDLIIRVKQFVAELFRYWWIIALFCIISSAGFLYKHFTHQTEFSANLRFVVEGQSNSSGGLRSLLGTFGIKREGGLNPFKLQNVGRSSEMLIKVLGKKNANGINIANEIFRVYNFGEEWSSEESNYRDYKFPVATNMDDLSELDKKMFKKLYRVIWGTEKNRDDCLARIEFDEGTGIYRINVLSLSEDLSLDLSKVLYENITYFFETSIFENQLKSAEILKMKADSIKIIRDGKILDVARLIDSNRGLYTQSAKSQQTLLNQEIGALSLAYIEILKNYEMTDVNLKDIQPLFLTIDEPYLPLSASTTSLIKSLIFGFVLGGFLAGIFIISRMVYRDAMNS